MLAFGDSHPGSNSHTSSQVSISSLRRASPCQYRLKSTPRHLANYVMSARSVDLLPFGLLGLRRPGVLDGQTPDVEVVADTANN